MDEKLQEDWLDARLRDEAPYIDDAGFTSQVVHKLPARQVRRSYRNFILLGITLAACLFAYWLAGGCNLAYDAFANVAFIAVSWMLICVGAVGVLVMAGGLAAALSRTRGRSR
jgi:hypothetical protein